MIARWQRAVVAAVEPLTARITSYRLTLTEPMTFVAGQHVDVRLTAPDGYRAIRSYSIASAPAQGAEIELAIERLPDGEVSPFFHDVVRAGDEIELRGPLGGHFVWTEADGGPLLLAGGGSGVVPLVSMLRYRRERGARVPVLFLYSARTWEDAAFRDELLALEAARDGLTLIFTLTREAPRRAADYGRRIDAALMREALATLDAPPALAFVCGTNGFVNAAADGALAAGVAAERIRTERYGG